MTAMDTQRIEIPAITLTWSDWHAWDSLLSDARSDPQAVRVPDASGVYEARYTDAEERLTIGKASNLQARVKRGLVRGKLPHSAGRRIRPAEDLSRIVVRWAETERPAAVEEELHRQYLVRFGHLPKCTRRT